MTTNLFDQVTASAQAIRRSTSQKPRIGIVLGSGMGSFADRVTDQIRLPYAEIPGFPAATVAGHAGEMILGTVSDSGVVVLRGRFHYYEGHDLQLVTLPVRVLAALGAQTLILTAAVGGIQPELRTGDIVCMHDHINLLGANPLRGLSDERLGPRFVDLTEVYSSSLRALARDTASNLGITLREGVYVAMPGPSYETPAEIRMAGLLGGDVVGMSTVPEAIVARQCGMDVLALALVTNAAAGVTGEAVTHEGVLRIGNEAGDRLGNLLAGIVSQIGRIP